MSFPIRPRIASPLPSPLGPALIFAVLSLPAVASADDCRPPAGRAAAIELSTPNGAAHGTGIVWDGSGRVVTNHHVVAAGIDPMLTFEDGSRVPARVVADDRGSDLAVLEPVFPAIVRPPPPPIASAARGSEVVAIGNTGGRGLRRGDGIVVSVGRSVDNGVTLLTDAIESTVPLMPGDSGGPMFDCAGRLVGISTAAVISGGRSRIGYALPAAAAARLVATLSGAPVAPRPTAPRLGALVRPLAGGLAVLGITPGTPAARAGLRVGDLILGVDDHPSREPADIVAAVAAGVEVGSVFVTIDRGGSPLALTVDLARG